MRKQQGGGEGVASSVWLQPPSGHCNPATQDIRLSVVEKFIPRLSCKDSPVSKKTC